MQLRKVRFRFIMSIGSLKLWILPFMYITIQNSLYYSEDKYISEYQYVSLCQGSYVLEYKIYFKYAETSDKPLQSPHPLPNIQSFRFYSWNRSSGTFCFVKLGFWEWKTECQDPSRNVRINKLQAFNMGHISLEDTLI